MHGSTTPPLTVPKAAERLHIHPATLRRWIKDGTVRTIVSPSGRHRVPADEVERLLTVGAAS